MLDFGLKTQDGDWVASVRVGLPEELQQMFLQLQELFPGKFSALGRLGVLHNYIDTPVDRLWMKELRHEFLKLREMRPTHWRLISIPGDIREDAAKFGKSGLSRYIEDILSLIEHAERDNLKMFAFGD